MSAALRRRGLIVGLGAAVVVSWVFWASVVARAEDSPPVAPAPDKQPAEPAKPVEPKKPAAPSAADAKCLACHGDAAKAGGHLVDFAKSARSAHAGKECADCHSDYDAFPHGKSATTIGCAECHEESAKVLAKGVHGKPVPPGSTVRAARCVDCHGVHDVFKAKERESRLYPLNVPMTCGQCHGGAPERVPNGGPGHYRRTRFTDDTHGEGLLEAGLIVAPTCLTCHGQHMTVKTTDPASPVHPSHVADTCGACHVGIVERYRQSVHGTTPRGSPEKNYNAKEPATCTDCHRPHHIRRPGEDMRQATIATCGKCHSDRLGTFRNTYHGRVSDLGYGGAASCADCHTAHDIRKTEDPASSVHPGEHRMKTCAQCHKDATERFSTYAVHANPDDKEQWPILYWGRTLMTTMIVITWCLAGLHILLWFLRAIREPRPDHAHDQGRWYQRWPPFYRGLHITVASTFLLLALTGLPLRFHDAAWSPILYKLLGGPVSVRYLHRFGGAMTFGYFAVYIVHIVRRMMRGEKGLFSGPTSMLPRWKDAQDIRANFRWFLHGGPRPQFDRWTYWEKFDFFAEVWGVGFIGLTGLVMWFPIASTSVLPGWMVNLAHILHSYEALLATGFIFSIHFFHANLRPGKFPLDPIIFTGRIPEAELALERPAEYARMKADGRLEREALPPPDPKLVRRAYLVGGILMSVGIGLLLLMLSTVFL